MSKDEKAIYTAGAVIAVVCACGLAGIAYVLDNRIRRVETVVNTLPERMVKAVRGAVGI
jgi:hypothetical protein